jgi:hypothetical protein
MIIEKSRKVVDICNMDISPVALVSISLASEK